MGTGPELTLDEMTAVLLDRTSSPGDLTAAAEGMYDLFRAIVAVDLDDAGTALPSGLALSPRLAATCLKDAPRTAVFLRGIDEALRETSAVEVLYAGTGPFATLALPLMSRFPGVHWTLLDIHPFSIDSVRALVRHFGFVSCDFVVGDATTYVHPRPVDVLIVEALQSALAKEPQVAIARHLAPQLAPGGVMIPERITVDVVLVDGGAESQQATRQPVPSGARIKLGTAVELTRHLTTLELRVRVPEHHHTLAYFTRVEVFGSHVLDEYESGITYPLLRFDVNLRPGHTLEFRFEAGPQPGLRIVGTAARWLRDRLPGLKLDDVTIESRIAQAMARAQERGYSHPPAIRLYVLLCFALGPHFDDRARVREHLAGAAGALDDRLLRMPEWSHPNCWLQDDSDEWDAPTRGPAAAIDWPDSDPVPTQLQAGYGFQLDVPWYATPESVVNAMLDLAGLAADDFLLDLGSGDGRIPIAAARRFGVRAAGIEIDPERVRAASESAAAAGVASLVSFRRGDLFDADLGEASVITLYLLLDVNLRLRERLRRLRPGTRIISRSFDMGDWSAERVVETPFGPIYRWLV